MAELGFAEPIDPDRPLNEIGLDSLRSVTLANNLEDEFGILISISELITGPTINQLSEHLSGLFAQRAKNDDRGFLMRRRTRQTAIAANAHAHDEAAIEPAENGNGALDYFDVGAIGVTPPANVPGNGAGAVTQPRPMRLHRAVPENG